MEDNTYYVKAIEYLMIIVGNRTFSDKLEEQLAIIKYISDNFIDESKLESFLSEDKIFKAFNIDEDLKIRLLEIISVIETYQILGEGLIDIIKSNKTHKRNNVNFNNIIKIVDILMLKNIEKSTINEAVNVLNEFYRSHQLQLSKLYECFHYLKYANKLLVQDMSDIFAKQWKNAKLNDYSVDSIGINCALDAILRVYKLLKSANNKAD